MPSIPLHALGAIKDENIRVVLQAIVDGWNVRNGHAGKGDNRFITAAEVENIRGSLAASLSGKLGQTGVGSGDGGLGAGKISQIINDLQASIMESQLWIELGERIKLIGVVCGRGRNPTLRLWPAIFSGEIDVFPSERRNMGQEIGR